MHLLEQTVIYHIFAVFKEVKEMSNKDISPYFVFNYYDAQVSKKLLKYEGTPDAIKYFKSVCHGLTDYGYWFILSTLWVSCTDGINIDLWKELFSSERMKRKKSIMKPSELKRFEQLPWHITAYRVHRENETDWIAYTINFNSALKFANIRGVNKISEYVIDKRHVIALFLRRGESEIIMLNKSKAKFIKNIDILVE